MNKFKGELKLKLETTKGTKNIILPFKYINHILISS